ncbi:MAG: membrane dipeptidase [Planctomycetaceae bacterium]
MLIFDAHLDMAWNAVEWNRDLMLTVDELRKFERQFPGLVPGDCTVTWPELRKGGVGITISTLLPRLHRKDKPLSHYQSREAAYGACHGQLAYYLAMEKRGAIRAIPDRQTLDAHVAEWEANPNGNQPIGYILSMEGSPSILYPQQIEEWYNAGLRLLGPAHYGPGPYCYGTGSEGGLNAEGRELIKEMQRVGVLLDVTHLADQSFWEALDIYDGPVIASHHNCRAITPNDRQFDDEQLKELIKRGAVIGAVFDAWMIAPGWTIGVTKPEESDVTLEKLVNHIDHICQLAGNANHCGIGSDLDGGFGKEQSPKDLDTIADLYKVAEILEKRGYSQADIEGIMCKNFVEFFRRAWK